MSAFGQKKLQADCSSGSKVRDQTKLKIVLLVKCYGDLRIWRYRTSSLNTEISVFGTERVNNTYAEAQKTCFYCFEDKGLIF